MRWDAVARGAKCRTLGALAGRVVRDVTVLDLTAGYALKDVDVSAGLFEFRDTPGKEA
jgi:hypothetical protein